MNRVLLLVGVSLLALLTAVALSLRSGSANVEQSELDSFNGAAVDQLVATATDLDAPDALEASQRVVSRQEPRVGNSKAIPKSPRVKIDSSSFPTFPSMNEMLASEEYNPLRKKVGLDERRRFHDFIMDRVVPVHQLAFDRRDIADKLLEEKIAQGLYTQGVNELTADTRRVMCSDGVRRFVHIASGESDELDRLKRSISEAAAAADAEVKLYIATHF